VIHRDLKPENILVTGSGDSLRPKIVDFGIARILEGTTYTMTGAFLGTCSYMSPEQVQQPHAADPRSDIYSLGVTLYQLCTGKLPFEGNHFAVMMAHVNETPVAPSQLRAELPPALERLILDALSKDPSGRPPSCEVFRDRLDGALSSIAEATSVGAVFPPVVRARGGSELVLIPGGSFRMGPHKREVHLEAFYIDRTPVTNKEFATFLEVTGYRPDDEDRARFVPHVLGGKLTKRLENHPVVYVSWFDARAYAAWAGKRLPTEFEWEAAAAGADRERANLDHLGFGCAPAGAYGDAASEYGAVQMLGDVWEWTSSDFEAYPGFTAFPYPEYSEVFYGDAYKVLRGGAWATRRNVIRTTFRNWDLPQRRQIFAGIRCARDG
jgi:formylglycine-generating enzyme required for sulfatase activity